MNSQALNMFAVFDRELQRMHDLHTLLVKNGSMHMQHQMTFGGMSHSQFGNDATSVYMRIQELQQVMLDLIKVADKELQEKIAEHALMGVADDKG